MQELIDFFTPDRIMEIAGLGVGLAYLYFEYHANRLVWLMSVIMPVISLFIYFRAGIYADFAINIYYLIIAVYGYVVWTFGLKRKKREPLPITRMPGKYYIGAVAALAAIFAFLAWGLVHFTNSNVPYWDAFTTALSIVAMWMLARKYAEQNEIGHITEDKRGAGYKYEHNVLRNVVGYRSRNGNRHNRNCRV